MYDRWGDSQRDRDALDRWITREPDWRFLDDNDDECCDVCGTWHGGSCEDSTAFALD